MAIKAVSKLLKDSKPQHIFLVVTHCDIQEPHEEMIRQKLETYKKFAGIEIPEKNIVRFDNSMESLFPLVEGITQGTMHFDEDLD